MCTHTETDHISECISVFGAANMDIGGKPFSQLIRQDSNPGIVRTSPGGVGRNIAHNLSLLGCKVRFVSAFGDDAFAHQITEGCGRLGIDTNDSIFCSDGRTSTYLYITGDDGEMELAVSDMDIYSRITAGFIESRSQLLADSGLVIIDTNLPEEALTAICKSSKCPVFAEPVSRVKAARLRDIMPYLYAVTPNLQEAEVLSGRSIDPSDAGSLEEAAEAMLGSGVRNVIITLGPGGCFYTDGKIKGLTGAFPSDMVNGNGAGDALMAGLACGYVRGLTFERSVMLGMGAAAITVETSATNNPFLTFEAAAARAGLSEICHSSSLRSS